MRANVAKPLASGFYLATSWTWSIGLFLPTVLHADAGNGAWLAFLLCDVVGAAGLVLILRDRAVSLAFLQRHAPACRAFSTVTIAAQALFAGWLASRLTIGPILAAAAFLLLAGILFERGAAWRQGLGAFAWIATALAFAMYLAASPVADLGGALRAEILHWDPRMLFTLPILALGFLLCPCLDGTLHEVLQDETPQTARHAFLLVFPGLFGAMLLFSLSYRDELGPLLLHPSIDPGDIPAYLQIVLIALLAQVGLTVLLHARLLRGPVLGNGITRGPAIPLLVGACAVLAFVAGDVRVSPQMSLNAALYRTTIGFYGIVAPWYVWSTAWNPDTAPRTAPLLLALALLAAAVPSLVTSDALFLYPVAVLLVLGSRRIGSAEYRQTSR